MIESMRTVNKHTPRPTIHGAVAALALVSVIVSTSPHAFSQEHTVRMEAGSGALEDSTDRFVGPQLIHRVEPKFPTQAAEAGITEAQVIIQLTIDKEGLPRSWDVLRESKPGYGFKKATVVAVRQWRYMPGTKDGEPVEVYMTETIEFRREAPDA